MEAATVTREQALAALAECTKDDPEHGHQAADTVLCDLLESLGYGDVVSAWGKIEKWYA